MELTEIREKITAGIDSEEKLTEVLLNFVDYLSEEPEPVPEEPPKPKKRSFFLQEGDE